ncbi:conserved Plasmodium protein, unknown function [Plasmodium reichenowi]|uniref:Uncharacterized protein n=1 Tax=Plasmodium reichenowi TaxID=5854 RepID=A0A2P9DM34_PLARE|nr:conserved Plasmodium protein, unknown function [Plasmodium reichenowi]
MNTKNDVNENIILNCKNLKRNIKRKIENFYDDKYVDTSNYLNKRKNYGVGLKKDIFEKSKNESIKIDTPPLYNNNKRKLQLDYSDVKKQKINNNITSNVYQNNNVIINNLSNDNLNNISNHSEVKDSNKLLNPLSSEIIKNEGNNNIIYNDNERKNIKEFSIIPFEEQNNTNTILASCDENNNENYNIKKNVLNILYQKDIFYNKLKNQIQKYKPLEIKCMDISLLLNKYKHESNNNSFNYHNHDNIINTQGDMTRTQGDIIKKQDYITNTQDDIINTQDNITNTQDDIINTQDDIINTRDDIINTQDNIINRPDNIINRQDNIINKQDHNNINNAKYNENIISSLHNIQQEPIYVYNKNETNMESCNMNNSTSYNNNNNNNNTSTTNYGKIFINDYQINNYDNNIFLKKDNNYINKSCQNIKHCNNTIDNSNINPYKYFSNTNNINNLNDNMSHYIYENIINFNNLNNTNQINNNVYISNFNINNNNDNIT